MNEGTAAHFRDSKACRDKWKPLIRDFGKIYDYHNGTGHNQKYWDLIAAEREDYLLPKTSDPEMYHMIEAFHGD